MSAAEPADAARRLMLLRVPRLRPESVLAGVAIMAGFVAWVVYLRADLVLSHYDARAHLVVARRVIDSLTPGWRQIGAVWLPLPHLVNLLPAQVDLLYRSGAFASAVAIGSLGTTVWASTRLVRLVTGSVSASVVASVLLLINPSVLYLHTTPMTEPLLLALNALVVLWLYEWVDAGGGRVPRKLDAVLFLAMWTRYEAWPVVAAAVAAAAFAAERQGTWGGMVRRAARVTLLPAIAVLLFVLLSRATTGSWFVTGGFFEPDPLYEGRLLASLVAVWWGTHRLGGYTMAIVALSCALAVCVIGSRDRARTSWLIPVSLWAAAILPLYAFFEGHPFRVRYMIPPLAACAVFAGMACGLLARAGAGRSPENVAPDRRLRPPGTEAGWRHAWASRTTIAAGTGAVLIVAALLEAPPFGRGPLLDEFTWDAAAREGRRAVTSCLAEAGSDDGILASMGSLAHYMHDLSREGFDLADFIHEGNGAIWTMALATGPALHARWMLVEEQSEGGDLLARRIREDVTFATGMRRVCEGGGVALYRRE